MEQRDLPLGTVIGGMMFAFKLSIPLSTESMIFEFNDGHWMYLSG